jgi:CheY-like chemotaxis protein
MPQRILIADDNPTFRKALRQLLEGVDHWEVVEARDGQEAVARSVEVRPDMIVLDLAMPEKDGFTAAREISTLFPATPILMCTMHISPQLEVEAEKSGIRKVISKVHSVLLVPAIQQLLNRQDAAVQDAKSVPIQVVAAEAVAAPAVAPTAAPTAVEPTQEPPPSDLPKNVA